MSSVSAFLTSLRTRSAAHRLVLVLGCLAGFGAPCLSAQTPGTVDTSFSSFVIDSNVYALSMSTVFGTTPLLLVGGDLDSYDVEFLNGTAYDHFTAPLFGNAGRIIYTITPEVVLHPNGTTPTNPYFLLGGLFGRSATQIKDADHAQNITRIDVFGTVDATFNPGIGADNYVTAILPLSDGGMVVGGEFENFNGVSHQHLVRLDGTGAIVGNSIFDSSLGFDGTVLSLAAQQNPNSKAALPQVLVAGIFSNVKNTTHQKLVRINADGSIDGSFNPSFDARTTVVVSQPDGKILVGGDFSNVNGTPTKHMVRLNYDGSIDTTFTASVTGQPFGFADPPAVYVIHLLEDGSMYLGGNFTTVNGVPRNFLALVDANGQVMTTFDPGKSVINAVQALLVLPQDRSLIVAENLSKSLDNTQTRPPSVVRLVGTPPVVSLVAFNPTVTKTSGKNGSFKLKRSDGFFQTEPLTVFLKESGTALESSGTAPADYLRLQIGKTRLTTDVSGAGKGDYEITFAPGETSKKILVIPERKVSTSRPASTTVTLTVVADPNDSADYTAPPAQTVTILNQ